MYKHLRPLAPRSVKQTLLDPQGEISSIRQYEETSVSHLHQIDYSNKQTKKIDKHQS